MEEGEGSPLPAFPHGEDEGDGVSESGEGDEQRMHVDNAVIAGGLEDDVAAGASGPDEDDGLPPPPQPSFPSPLQASFHSSRDFPSPLVYDDSKPASLTAFPSPSPSPRRAKMTLRSLPKSRIPSLTLFSSSGEAAVRDVEKRYIISRVCRSTSGTVTILEKKRRRVSADGEGGRYSVMKRQAIRDQAVKEKAAREIRIMEQLSSLALSHRTPNFIQIEKWFNSSRVPFSSTSSSSPDLYIVMEFAEQSLSSFRPLTLPLYRSILFQLLFSLSVAQNEYLFVHNDLHLRNILLQSPSLTRPFLAFHDRGKVWYLQGNRRLLHSGFRRLIFDSKGRL